MKEPKKKWILQGWGVEGSKWLIVSLISFMGIIGVFFLEKEFDMEIPNFVMVLLVIGTIGGFAMAEGKSFWTSGTPH